MVKLTKERAKKPIIETGAYYVRDSVDFTDRANPKMLYCLQVDDQDPTIDRRKRAEYTLVLTEDEMLSVATEWMSRYATARRRKRQKEIDDARRREQAGHPGISSAQTG